MINIVKEIEKESFDPDEFVESLASHVKQNGETDLILLHDTFTKAISDLQILQERQKKKCEQLEGLCKEAETEDLQRVPILLERNKAASAMFHELDERINYVAAKVIHLGDQLESVNTPRSRAVEAQRLMSFFEEFHTPGALQDLIFTDSSRMGESANVIQKLYSISLELPDDKFGPAKRKIALQYDEVEKNLIEEFVRAHREGNVGQMTKVAELLTNFKGYNQCIDAFIEISHSSAFLGHDVFRDVIPLCERNYKIIQEVFSNPEEVMAKFVLNFYSLKLQNYIKAILSDKTNAEKYLSTLHELYRNTVKLSNELARFEMGSDETFLPKLTKPIFHKFLENYISVEVKFLKDQCLSALHRYYDSKNHQKKQIQTGGFQDFRRDLQAVIGTRANINIAQIEDYGGETFVSEDLAKYLLQITKKSLDRCVVLSQPSDLPANAFALLETLLQHLHVEHIDYALDLGLQAVPIPEGKTFPRMYFFDIVRRTNNIVQHLEKFYSSSISPLIVSTQKQSDCMARHKDVLDSIEFKLDAGLDRCINAIVGWVKTYLQSEQKRADFKPEVEKKETLPSPACLTVVQNMSSICLNIRECLDEKNAPVVLSELGCRFHRVIYDHLSQYQFNTSEAVYAVCDVIEYRKCAAEFKIPLVTILFETLHSLWNLLLVRPENLKQISCGGPLAELDESVILNFIQLRSDYKTQKLGNFLKGVPA